MGYDSILFSLHSAWLPYRGGLLYHSPHKFRHGHAVYAHSRAKDVPALKAVSQNLLHENLSIADGVHGVLSETDVRQQIATPGNGVANSEDVQELRSLVSRLLAKLERSGAAGV